MKTGICKNCGADEGLHHYETMQCPKNGIEEIRFDKLTGKFYPQQWESTTFHDNGTFSQSITEMIFSAKVLENNKLIEMSFFQISTIYKEDDIFYYNNGIGEPVACKLSTLAIELPI